MCRWFICLQSLLIHVALQILCLLVTDLQELSVRGGAHAIRIWTSFTYLGLILLRNIGHLIMLALQLHACHLKNFKGGPDQGSSQDSFPPCLSHCLDPVTERISKFISCRRPGPRSSSSPPWSRTAVPMPGCAILLKPTERTLSRKCPFKHHSSFHSKGCKIFVFHN